MTKQALTLSFLAVLTLPLFPSHVAGQFAPPSRSGRSQPQQLPLSANTPGSVTTGQATAPAASSNSVNTLNSSIQIQGAFQGSTPAGVASKETLLLSLDEAIKRGLAYNLGLIGAQQAERQARAQRLGTLAQLLPDITGIGTVAVEQASLATLGLQSAKGIPVQFGRVIGPFNFFEAGAAISQTVVDFTAVRNYRSSKEIVFANKLNVRDSRDLVILAVAGAYLQVVAEAARVDSAQAQLETARALYEQAVDQNRAGLNARIDVNRSLVEFQTQQLRLISLETDLATQKLALGRLIGLPLGQAFMLTTAMEYHPTAPVVLEEALNKAFESRADLQASQAQVRAAKHARKAAEAQRTPAVTFNGSYVLAGVNPSQSNGVFAFFAGVDFPIWRGGRIQKDIAEADAVLAQRSAEYEDASGRVDFEVRNAFLRLTATNRQLTVAESNRALARDTLRQARDRFTAGVADTIEVVQAQESVAAAEQDYISGLYAYYLARLSLARATGDAQEGIASLLH